MMAFFGGASTLIVSMVCTLISPMLGVFATKATVGFFFLSMFI